MLLLSVSLITVGVTLCVRDAVVAAALVQRAAIGPSLPPPPPPPFLLLLLLYYVTELDCRTLLASCAKRWVCRSESRTGLVRSRDRLSADRRSDFPSSGKLPPSLPVPGRRISTAGRVRVTSSASSQVNAVRGTRRPNWRPSAAYLATGARCRS